MSRVWPPKNICLSQKSSDGHQGFSLPTTGNHREVPLSLKRKSKLRLPEISELDVVRHMTHLSYLNYSIDSGMYPLGSCTMKYNPRVNEYTAALFGFLHMHPMTPDTHAQGCLELMHRLDKILCHITGFSRVSLQPAAGAQGEYTGVRVFREYFDSISENRNKILIPDSAHGTNPATASLCGFQPIEIASTPEGRLDKNLILKHMEDPSVAGLMVTNPNTAGLFETEIKEICDIIHDKGGLIYCDGANLNAMLGITRPGDSGVDVMHFNMHKTFTTPHGGGGPGCGGLGSCAKLVEFLPSPMVEKNTNSELFFHDYDRKQSIGKVKDFYGHFMMMVRAYTYLRELGAHGVRKVGQDAILLANHIRHRLKNHFHIAYDSQCMHEVVFTDRIQKEYGITTKDIAKRLIDKGFHPPTIYFPLMIPGALMIEPTETESLKSVNEFCDIMIEVAHEAQDPEKKHLFESAPKNHLFGPIDETMAARNPVLTWFDAD